MKKYLLFIGILTLVSCSKSTEKDLNKMDVFVSELMQKMTLEEKIGQLNLITPGSDIPTGSVVSTDVESKIKNGQVGGMFGVIGPEKIREAQALAVNESRLKIPLLFGSDVIHGHKTTFPIPLGLASSWDTELIKKSAQIAADEATSDGLNWVFSPMVDISRDPRWGRVAEGSGEDAYLGSQIAKAMVTGYQGDDLSKNNTVMASVKHFALYGGSEAGRDYNTVDMSKLRMYNEYLPPYKAAVDAGVGSVMSSFNEIDGVPATGNKWLLTDLLRGEWGFDGLVVSDYTSVNEMIAHGMGDLQTVSALSLKAGLDMDMVGEGFLTTLKKSLDEGKITEADINLACRRILEAKYKLGLFDDPFRYIDEKRAEQNILTVENRDFARKAATHSFVLLKNNKQTLPLISSKKIALVGPLANNKNNMLGTWAVSGNPQLSIPVLEGIKNVMGADVKVRYAKGANITDDAALAKRANVFGERVDIDARSPEVLIAEAVLLAKNSDVVVAVVGEASEMSGEAASRSDIGLPQSQKNLLAALKKTGKPIVLVIMSGRPLTLEWENENADAILQVWFAGIEAGNAIADVLYGKYNPSGKLPMTFPRNVGQIPIYYNHKNTGRPFDANNKFTTKYLDVSNEPLYPFGYGLSYTTFDYKISQSAEVMDAKNSITFTAEISNTGNFDGEEVAQLYIHQKVGAITRPVKELKGFKKVLMKKGKTATVDFTLTVDDLKYYHPDLSFTYDPGEFEFFIGTSSNQDFTGRFIVK
ncbi:MAG: beta-glucosidase BglX [Bacteroidetes bacterium HGW-Bacteroidetes-13]|nr:MAG: beta-glucosidase BglX [Bacteroidetes bacterium HGW-Bacteroidetes-13]